MTFFLKGHRIATAQLATVTSVFCCLCLTRKSFGCFTLIYVCCSPSAAQEREVKLVKEFNSFLPPGNAVKITRA